MARSPFYVDGQSYPSQPLRRNYKADQYVDCYRTLTCFWKDINVKRNDYVKGYCLYALEIDPYYSFNIKRQGHCLWKGIGLIIQICIMPYTGFHLRVMDVYYALPQSVYQLYAVYILQNDRGNNSIWVFCTPNSLS